MPNNTIPGDTTLSTGDSDINNVIIFPTQIKQVAGQQYAIVINFAGAPQPPYFLGVWSGVTDFSNGHYVDLYPGGDLEFLQFSTNHWVRYNGIGEVGPFGGPFDVHFKTFVSVPEPAPIALLVGGVIGGMGIISRRRRR